MDKQIKWLFFVAGGVLTLAIAGAALFLVTQTAAASASESSMLLDQIPMSPNGGDGPQGFRGNGLMVGYEENFAKALGITVEELRTAKDAAFETTLKEAVADGRVTQDEADLIEAHRVLRAYIDRPTLTAEALGISVADLQATLDGGKSLQDLIEEAGLDRQTFQEKYQAAYQAAVQKAVDDDVITQAQADQILSNPGRGMGGRPGGRHPGRGLHQGDPEE